MQPFNEYIAGSSLAVATQELDRLVSRHEWFTAARRAKSLLTGEHDPALVLPMMFWPTVSSVAGKRHPSPAATAAEPVAVSAEDAIIGKFLEHGGYRIVPVGEDSEVEDVSAAAAFEDADGELLTEELAEIYLAQGLIAEAKEIYRRLSLRNNEKSIYFADIIERIDTEQQQIIK